MRWGGVTVAAFIVYHLLHLSTNTIRPGGASPSPYVRLVDGFQIWWGGRELYGRPDRGGISSAVRVLERVRDVGRQHQHPAASPPQRRPGHGRGGDHGRILDRPVLGAVRLGRPVSSTLTELSAGYYTVGDWVIDEKAPPGSIEKRLDTRKVEARLISPANRRALSVIIVGTGLAGASAAATLREAGYRVTSYCYHPISATTTTTRSPLTQGRRMPTDSHSLIVGESRGHPGSMHRTGTQYKIYMGLLWVRSMAVDARARQRSAVSGSRRNPPRTVGRGVRASCKWSNP